MPLKPALTLALGNQDVMFENNDSFAGKTDRLRQAKAEAEKEIAAYRAEREGAYQKKVSEVRLNSPTINMIVYWV